MNKVKIIIIASVTGLIFIVFILTLLFTGGRVSAPPSIPNTPTPAQFSEKELYITSISPRDTALSYLPAQPIEITFTQEVATNSLNYTISPPTEVIVVKGTAPNTLIFAPKTFWENGEVIISFLSTTTSTSGGSLKNPQTYKIKVAIPTIPDLEGAY
ncbi:MAG: hypothetical protein KBC00_00675 [Candidatus Levybacteria bacterium]|nr:hypothetical protein [Candidatus Levybacteria bacterium]MBP9814708.1 hypothetical protein [Candidatus Levybacteria bacterium]